MADYNIFQQYLAKPKSVSEYTADFDQVDARRQSLQQNALTLAAGQQKFNETRQANERNALVRAALQGLPKGATNEQRIEAMYATGTPEGFAAGDALGKTLDERRKNAALAGSAEADLADKQYKLQLAKHDKALGDMAGFQSPQDALASLQQSVKAGDIPAPQADVYARQLQSMNPADFPKWQLGMVKQLMSAKERMEYMAPNANTVATNERIAAEGAANRATQVKVQQMIADRGDTDVGFTPDAIANAAARYNVDGTLPPMGMGKSGAAGRTAILNEAARQKSGVDPAQQRFDQMDAKGRAQARAASMRAYSAAGKEGQAIQATNTALNHLETLEGLAKAQKNGNAQLFNAIANQLGKATGQAAPTNLAAAITMVSPEVSKSVIGAAGGQEERREFAKNFNPNASPEQALQGIGVIKELMGGRLIEAQRTYERTTERTDFKKSMLSPAAQRVLDHAHGVSNGAGKPSLSDIFKN